MAKKNETAKLSQVELQKLGGLEARRAQLQRAGAELDREYRDTLELIGDRYGKDLLSGAFRIGPDGSIVDPEGEVAESAKSEPQQLNG